MRLKNSLNANPQAPMPAEGLWEKSSLSFLQTMLLGVVSGATLFLGYIKSKDYNNLSQLLDSSDIWEKNRDIIKDLTEAINDPEQTLRLYGAEIICIPMNFADKLNKDCQVNSQKRFYIPGNKKYDPILADTIPKLGYKT